MRFYIFLFGTLVALSSCVSYRYIDIQVLYPGEVKMPSNIDVLHIIEGQKIEKEYVKVVFEDSALGNLYYYNLFINKFDSALSANFYESPRFNEIQVKIQKENGYENDLNKLSAFDQKRHLVLTIQKMVLTDTINPQIDRYDYYKYNFVATTSIGYLLKLELRNFGNQQIVDSYLLHDTLTWTSHEASREQTEKSLPGTIQVIEETADVAAKRYAQRLAPFWVSEERSLVYTKNKYMKRGYQSFLDNDTASAMKTWKRLYEIGAPYLASNAALNIAVLYEMRDDLDNCELWLNNSLKAKRQYQTDGYLKRVHERKALRDKLDKQIN